METIAIYVSVFGCIIVPLVGWVWKISVEQNFSNIKIQADLDRALFFKKFDEAKEIYVRKDLYVQATEFHSKEVDAKFDNMLEKMQGQFRVVTDDIRELKDIIVKNINNTNFTIPQHGGQ